MHTKSFRAQLDNLYEMLEFIKGYLETKKISQTCLNHIILAAEEALVNVINYSYPKDEKGMVEIVCEEMLPPGVKVSIKDEGVPFNPIKNIPSDTSLTEKHKTKKSLGGYGIYIYVELMDRIDYQRIGNKNILTLTKYFKSKT